MVTRTKINSAAVSAAAMALALVALSGCATKGFVRSEVANARTYTDTRVGEVRSDLDQVKALAERLATGPVELAEVSAHQVQFDFDDWKLKPEGQTMMDQLAAEIASHPKYVIEVRGYADATGTDRYNYRLGRERAEEVLRYLTTRHTLPTSRIAMVSFGEESPVADNESEEGRAQNRRVQVRLFEIKSPGEPVAVAP